MARRDTIVVARPAGLEGVELLQAVDTHHYFPRHFHDTYCVPVQERGAMVSLYRNRRNVLTPGDVDFLEPGEVHTSWEGDGSGWSYRCLYLDPGFVAFAGLERGDMRIPTLRQLAPHKDGVLFAALQSAHAGLLRTQDEALAGETRLTQAVAALLQKSTATKIASARSGAEPSHVRRVRQYLHDRLEERVSLRALAALVDLNPVYLVRAFRRATGLPPHAYQRQIRINRAQSLLRQGESPAAVAAATGFADQAHLTRAFRNALGITPAAYARAQTA
ncbi:AraC family transcriptional regulator [Dongia deserti]|uniref:AraC family transcriptional regulator n=1 Tax=Dongia deserti TaxID=2268030 RepID=UPI000E65B539|nr:AraC family transcriptional regulator [Dongia deserti]